MSAERGFQLHLGPMKSGKTGALLLELTKYELAGYQVEALKPEIEVRDNGIESRNGLRRDAHAVRKLGEYATRFSLEDTDVIGVDEVFMFDAVDARDTILHWMRERKLVLAASLDLSAMGRVMSTVTALHELKPELHLYDAVCEKPECSSTRATHTRIYDLHTGEPIVDGLPEIVPEDPDNPRYHYQPECRDCYLGLSAS